MPIPKIDQLGDAVRNVIRAYHGSPYDFDKFDASKIGTGEKAQAYGHGLYFAGNEEVAAQYRAALASHLVGKMPRPVGNILKSLGDLGFDDSRQAFEAIRTHGDWRQRWDVDGAAADELDRHISRLPPAGRTYEVEISYPEDSMLDWDAPISQQSDFVKERLAKVDPRRFGAVPHDAYGDLSYASYGTKREWNSPLSHGSLRWKTPWDTLIGHRVTGKSPESLTFLDTALPMRSGGPAYADLAALAKGEAKASEALREVGIPGIRYLDKFSRGRGEGTRNYVIFPGAEDSIRILRKY